MVADRADQASEDGVAQAAHTRHLAVGAGHARADDQLGAVQRRLAQRRQMLGRIGAVGVEEGEQVARGLVEAGLERCAVAVVGLVAHQAHVGVALDQLGGAVAAAVVHHQHLEAGDARLLQRHVHAEHTVEDGANAAFFVIGRNDNRERVRLYVQCAFSPWLILFSAISASSAVIQGPVKTP